MSDVAERKCHRCLMIRMKKNAIHQKQVLTRCDLLVLQWSRNNIANEMPQPQKYSDNAALAAAATDFVAESAGSYSPAGFLALCLCGRYSDCAGTWWHLPDWRACCWRPAPYICWRKWLHQRDHPPGERKTSWSLMNWLTGMDFGTPMSTSIKSRGTRY